MALWVHDSQCMYQPVWKIKTLGWNHCVVWSAWKQWGIMILLLIAASVQHAHQASLSPYADGLGRARCTEQRGPPLSSQWHREQSECRSQKGADCSGCSVEWFNPRYLPGHWICQVPSLSHVWLPRCPSFATPTVTALIQLISRHPGCFIFSWSPASFQTLHLLFKKMYLKHS